MVFDVAKVFLPAIAAFAIGIAGTPFLTHFLYSRQMWKKRVRRHAADGRVAKIFSRLHRTREVGTPRFGGVVVWGSALATVLLFRFAAEISLHDLADKFDFLSRGQTWLPFATLLVGAGIGLIDDWFEVRGTGDYFAGGLSLRKRLAIVALTGLLVGLWFFHKLEMESILVPFVGEIALGAAFVPFFVAVMLGVYSGGVIDGIDGLAGGVFAAIFAAYGGIAFFQNQVDLAAFCAVIVGGLLAFLWYNIPPARFYLSETGSMGLTMALAVVVFLTQAVAVLPIIAFPLVATSGSAALQLASKKFRNGKKIFLVAPLHHHFEAIGWPGYKVAMRYWVIAAVCAVVGMIAALLGAPV